MNSILFSLLFLLLTSLLPGQTQTHLIQVDTITPKELNQMLEEWIGKPNGPATRRAICAEALHSGRLDLIMTCFENGTTQRDTLHLVAEMPDRELRQRVAIRMLRSRPYWPKDQVTNMTGGMFIMETEAYLMVEPFTSTVAVLLPNVKLTLPMMRYSASRAQLADDLEAAMQAKTAEQLPSVPIAEPLAPAGVPSPSVIALPQPTKKNSPRAAKSAGTIMTVAVTDESSDDLTILYLTLAAGILAVLVWWRAAKKSAT
jgi:hypothetical protein